MKMAVPFSSSFWSFVFLTTYFVNSTQIIGNIIIVLIYEILPSTYIIFLLIDHEVIRTWPKENDNTVEREIGTKNRLKNGYFPNTQETKVTLRQHSRVKRAVST